MCVQKADVAGRRGQRHRQVRAEDDIGVLSGRVPSGRLSGIWTPPENWTSLILELPAGHADFREIKGSNTPDGEGQLQQQIDSLLAAGLPSGPRHLRCSGLKSASKSRDNRTNPQPKEPKGS